MISLTSEYALRAMIYLAQHSDRWPVSGKEIAAGAGIPAKYLSTILSNLVRDGVLESTRGKSGGFRMVKPSTKTYLIDVLAPFEQLDQRRCPFGNAQCGDDDPCLAHERWKKVVNSFHQFLVNTTVHDIAVRRRTTRV